MAVSRLEGVTQRSSGSHPAKWRAWCSGASAAGARTQCRPTVATALGKISHRRGGAAGRRAARAAPTGRGTRPHRVSAAGSPQRRPAPASSGARRDAAPRGVVGRWAVVARGAARGRRGARVRRVRRARGRREGSRRCLGGGVSEVSWGCLGNVSKCFGGVSEVSRVRLLVSWRCLGGVSCVCLRLPPSRHDERARDATSQRGVHRGAVLLGGAQALAQEAALDAWGKCSADSSETLRT